MRSSAFYHRKITEVLVILAMVIFGLSFGDNGTNLRVIIFLFHDICHDDAPVVIIVKGHTFSINGFIFESLVTLYYNLTSRPRD